MGVKNITIMDLLGSSGKCREKKMRQNVAIGATIGVAVGAVAGVLLAPKAGKETREDLKKGLEGLPERVKNISDKTESMLGDVKEKLTQKTQDLMDEATDKFEETRDDVQEDSRFKKPADISQQQVNAFKDKLK